VRAQKLCNFSCDRSGFLSFLNQLRTRRPISRTLHKVAGGRFG
jgi:hypothetical protein